MFLIRPDNTIYFAAIASAPFARPGFADLSKAIAFVEERDYPARGEA